MMQISLAKFILMFAALSLAIPESYAKRVGSSRSFGRQSQVVRQRSAPVPPMQRQQQAAPPAQRQTVPPIASQRAVPPVAPAQPIGRQAGGGFGGFFTGALIGMGLGSLISSNNQNPANQSSGSSGDWNDASGNDGQQANATQQPQRQEGNPFGVLLLLGIGALGVRYLVRRNRARQRQQGYARNGFR